MYFPSSDSLRLNITSAIVHFYLLEEMSMQSPSLFLMQRKKWNDLLFDINSVSEELTEKLARVLFDYLCLSSLGEARHAKTQCRNYFLSDFFTNNNCRETVYESGSKYNPVQFLPVLHRLFSKGVWGGNAYGGVKWGNIIGAALLYKKIPDKIFVDHVIDLCHNGGTAFDKGILVQLSGKANLMAILEMKCHCDSFFISLINQGVWSELTPVIIGLIKRMFEFNPSFDISKLSHVKANIYFPEPVKWGNGCLILKVKREGIDEVSDGTQFYQIKTLFKKNSVFNTSLNDVINSSKIVLNTLKEKIELIENKTEEEIKEEEEATKVKIKVKSPNVEVITEEEKPPLPPIPSIDEVELEKTLKMLKEKKAYAKAKKVPKLSYLDEIIKQKEEQKIDSNTETREE